MPEFDSMTDFVRFLRGLPVSIRAAEQRGRVAAAEIVRQEVVGVLGEYQVEDTGPFPAWVALAEKTQERREAAGFERNEPEFVTGALMDSVTATVEPDGRAAVGVASEMVGNGGPADAVRDIGEVAVAQELGDGLPQRSFLGIGAFRAEHRAIEAFVGPVIHTVSGQPLSNLPPEETP